MRMKLTTMDMTPHLQRADGAPWRLHGALHGVRFAAASLTVCEDHRIVAVSNAANDDHHFWFCCQSMSN